MAYGRPLKGKTRRVPITIHAPVGMLDIIDSYVDERAEAEGRAYSRSDFYAEAATALLHSMGIETEETENAERTKSVPKKSQVKIKENNTGNKSTKTAEKTEEETAG